MNPASNNTKTVGLGNICVNISSNLSTPARSPVKETSLSTSNNSAFTAPVCQKTKPRSSSLNISSSEKPSRMGGRVARLQESTKSSSETICSREKRPTFIRIFEDKKDNDESKLFSSVKGFNMLDQRDQSKQILNSQEDTAPTEEIQRQDKSSRRKKSQNTDDQQFTKSNISEVDVERVAKETDLPSQDVDIAELLCSEVPSENYWKMVAEERRIALEKALDQNRKLWKEVIKLREERKILRPLAENAQYLANVVRSLTGIEVDDPDATTIPDDQDQMIDGSVSSPSSSSRKLNKDTSSSVENEEVVGSSSSVFEPLPILHHPSMESINSLLNNDNDNKCAEEVDNKENVDPSDGKVTGSHHNARQNSAGSFQSDKKDPDVAEVSSMRTVLRELSIPSLSSDSSVEIEHNS